MFCFSANVKRRIGKPAGRGEAASKRGANEMGNVPHSLLRIDAMVLREVPDEGAGEGEDGDNVSHGHPGNERNALKETIGKGPNHEVRPFRAWWSLSRTKSI
jgi:hypothetical protein